MTISRQSDRMTDKQTTDRWEYMAVSDRWYVAAEINDYELRGRYRSWSASQAVEAHDAGDAGDETANTAIRAWDSKKVFTRN